MALPMDPALVHARALRGRGSTLPPGMRPSDEILESWARCLDHGLDYAAKLRLPVVDAAELARRRDRLGVVRRLAQAELETLMQQIAGSNYLLAFADAEGFLVDVVTDNRFAMSGDEDIVVGSCWREDVAGTNGLGTALSAGRCVAVTGPDHYYLRLADVSCTASPIRDAEGRIVGVLDASSYVDSRQRHTQALVQMSTAHIENVLLAEQRAGQLLVAIHPRREFLRTLSAGLLAFDGHGTLTALNARAQLLLAGLDPQRGRHFEQLFGERFASFVARLHGASDVALTDRLGSTIVAHRVGPDIAPVHAVPRPRAPAAPAAAGAPARAEGVPRLVIEDREAAEALRAVENALRHGVPALLRGETGSGKKRLVREAVAACGLGDRVSVLRCASLEGVPDLADPAGDAASLPVLVLDELADLSPAAQARWLAWLDSRGDALGLRLVATTQHDGGTGSAVPGVRADLLYRLQGVAVRVPALRQRSDFAACARHALAQVAPLAHLDPAAIDLLQRHPWPGNWRELQSVLTRVWFGLAQPGTGAHTPLLVGVEHIEPLLAPAAAPASTASVLHREVTSLVLREWERQGGSISATARRLGVSRNTVYRHLRDADRRAAADREPDTLR